MSSSAPRVLAEPISVKMPVRCTRQYELAPTTMHPAKVRRLPFESGHLRGNGSPVMACDTRFVENGARTPHASFCTRNFEGRKQDSSAHALSNKKTPPTRLSLISGARPSCEWRHVDAVCANGRVDGHGVAREPVDVGRHAVAAAQVDHVARDQVRRRDLGKDAVALGLREKKKRIAQPLSLSLTLSRARGAAREAPFFPPSRQRKETRGSSR